jgi:hypothetical protein
MKFNSDIKLWGNLGVTVYDHSTGAPVKVFSVTKKNQITREGQRLLLHLLGDQGYDVYYPSVSVPTNIASRRLGFVIVGNTATAADKTDTKATFNGGDTPIWTSDAFSRSVGNITFEPSADPGSEQHILIQVSSASSEIDGQICEAGIVTADGEILYARQIFTPILMGRNMSITFNWQLGMTLP